jgi:pimeloyl-ACP methyl ester carboxylesterase
LLVVGKAVGCLILVKQAGSVAGASSEHLYSLPGRTAQICLARRPDRSGGLGLVAAGWRKLAELLPGVRRLRCAGPSPALLALRPVAAGRQQQGADLGPW